MLEYVNMTGDDFNTYYSSVISLCSMRTVVFLAELNNIETSTGEISNSYLNARTTENIVLNYVPEFAPFGHSIHLLLINTALYGIKSSGDMFHS